jgi:hypothetical protein
MAEVNEAKREKSQVEDINRSLYDFRYEEKDANQSIRLLGLRT